MPHPDLDLPALRAIAQAATQGDIAGRLRAFLKPHVHISAAHKDALADAASYFEEIQPDIATLIDRAEKAEAEVTRLSKREDYAIRWANRSVDSVKEAWGETESERDAWKARAEKAEAALVEAMKALAVIKEGSEARMQTSWYGDVAEAALRSAAKERTE